MGFWISVFSHHFPSNPSCVMRVRPCLSQLQCRMTRGADFPRSSFELPWSLYISLWLCIWFIWFKSLSMCYMCWCLLAPVLLPWQVERGVSESEARRLYHDVLRDEKASTEAGTWTDLTVSWILDPTPPSRRCQAAFLKAFGDLRPWIRGKGKEVPLETDRCLRWPE